MKNPPTNGGPVAPNSVRVFKLQTLSHFILLPLTLMLPLVLLGMYPRIPLADHDQSERSRQVEVTCLLREDLQRAESHAVYWRAVARRSGGKDAHATLRAHQFRKNVVWLKKRLATLRPLTIGSRFQAVCGPTSEL